MQHSGVRIGRLGLAGGRAASSQASLYDRGSGPPLIVVPGVQGRWEWMRPALDALSLRCRTISYTLCGDIGAGCSVDSQPEFDCYLRQLDGIVDRLGVRHPAICGVSYGGLIALRYAATRPDRVGAVVFVSAPAPGWKPSSRQSAQIASPWLSTPGFVLGAPFRVWPEIRAALPGWRERLRFAVVHGFRVLAAPSIPSMMARRVRQQEAIDFERDLDRITAPVLVVTGEETLDTVVPVHVTQRYCDRIPGARYVRMDGTGHIGMITQPDRFATVVAEFVHAHHQ